VRVDHQIGLEKTPAEYIEKMVAVFREVWRVLHGDGTLWINIGDSYAGSWGAQSRGNTVSEASSGLEGTWARSIKAHPLGLTRVGSLKNTPGIKAKDLIGIPWMLAFALRADGWYLRQDIIWAKPNPMPESVTDRCTKSHEYIFLLSKGQRYYYNQEAILEPVSPGTHARLSQDVEAQIGRERANGGQKTNGNMKAVARRPVHGWCQDPGNSDHTAIGYATPERYGKEEKRKLAAARSGIKNNESFSDKVCLLVDKRNKRSVWTVVTESFAEAHFATFPTELIKPCILAGCPPGGTVLDPFAGSLTTMQVARDLSCKSIGIELNPEYIDIGLRCRLQQHVLDFSK
jgi:DNA modification methylase